MVEQRIGDIEGSGARARPITGPRAKPVPEPQRSQLLAAAAAADGAQIALRRAVRRAKDAGGSIREIAALLSKSTNTIDRWLDQGGPNDDGP
ncbi:helix-turn-helix domain-containing protein [Mycolicibacterium fortuitum]